ncbi:MAG: amino acid ABC transporter substrate-binding protein, partial [Deltaproteobacteria bacterium]|nr:amino acid ABC transporter substrate-binding protein [Deltaproteobacteria bacterium]
LPPKPFITNAYDGAAVIGLAAYAAKVKGLPLTSANIRDQLRVVANPPGEVVIPGEFAKAFALLKAGKAINYEGAAGSVDFDRVGDVVTPIEIWEYRDGKLKTLRTETP